MPILRFGLFEVDPDSGELRNVASRSGCCSHYSATPATWSHENPRSGKVSYKDSPGGQPWIAAAYVMAGRGAEVEQWAAVHDKPYRLALIHAALGNKDRTFDELNNAAEIVPDRVVGLLSFPEMRLLRGDPRLAALRKKLRLP